MRKFFKVFPKDFLKIVVPILVGLLIVFLGFWVIKKNIISKKSKEAFTQYTIEKDQKNIKVNRNGFVNFNSGKGSFSQKWDQDKIQKLYEYIKANGKRNILILTKGDYVVIIIYEGGTTQTYYLPADDFQMEDIFDTFVDPGQGSGNGGDGNDGNNENGGIFDFSSPTPGSGLGITTPTPIGHNIPPMPEDCPLWLLSICIYPRRPVYGTPIPTITPNPSVKPDCSYWIKDIYGKAIISNTYCIKPSPTPI